MPAHHPLMDQHVHFSPLALTYPSPPPRHSLRGLLHQHLPFSFSIPIPSLPSRPYQSIRNRPGTPPPPCYLSNDGVLLSPTPSSRTSSARSGGGAFLPAADRPGTPFPRLERWSDSATLGGDEGSEVRGEVGDGDGEVYYDEWVSSWLAERRRDREMEREEEGIMMEGEEEEGRGRVMERQGRGRGRGKREGRMIRPGHLPPPLGRRAVREIVEEREGDGPWGLEPFPEYVDAIESNAAIRTYRFMG